MSLKYKNLNFLCFVGRVSRYKGVKENKLDTQLVPPDDEPRYTTNM
jgi:hypothetical protein